MKRLWKKLQVAWKMYWKDDTNDRSKSHLSQSDKRSLWYGGFMMSIITIAACLIITSYNNIRITRQNGEDMELALNTIVTYMASATNDEYDKITETIRHDLVFSEYGENIEEYIKYIPNTAESCCLEREIYLSRAYLVCCNTGELYALDIFETDELPEDKKPQNSTQLSFGYDEISQANIHIEKRPDQKGATANAKKWIMKYGTIRMMAQ